MVQIQQRQKILGDFFSFAKILVARAIATHVGVS